MRVEGLYTHSYKDSHQKVGVVLESLFFPNLLPPSLVKNPQLCNDFGEVKTLEDKLNNSSATPQSSFFFKKNPHDSTQLQLLEFTLYTPPGKINERLVQTVGFLFDP